jgi:DNA-binding IclR family transcriptional regulator
MLSLDDLVRRLSPRLLQTAREVSERLGYRA